MPFHEFKTNTDISTTPKRRDDTSHVPVPQAEEEEHENEVSVLVTPPPSTIRPILKYNNNLLSTAYQSPQKIPATSNEIRAAMTSSRTSPESPEHNYSHHPTPQNDNKAGDNTETSPPKTIPLNSSNQAHPYM